MNPIISIVIPTKDRAEILINTLDAAVKAIQHIDAEIIVVNDSKTSQPVIPQYNGIIKQINNPKNGVASARNLGAAIAKGDWILFLDDDMILNQESVDCYLKYTQRIEKICVNIDWIYPHELISEIAKTAFGRFLIKYGFTSMRGWNNNPSWNKNSSIPINSITSQNLFINRNYFIETQGYNENFPFAGAEDHAFSSNLKKNGFTIYVDTSAVMYHNEADRIGPEAWFNRKERGGKTRKTAVEQGFTELEINLNSIKKVFYFFSPFMKPILKFILFFTDSIKMMDFISFQCYKTLLGIAIYEGYTK
jgi:glycosyltransferase involved in cell wall biosynthesis